MRSPESGPENRGEGPDKPSRRRFLEEGLASLGALAVNPRIAQALTNQELLRERSDERYFNLLTKDPMARKQFQETPTRGEVAATLRSIAKTKAPWIEQFNRDAKRMHRGALAFRDVGGVLMGNGTILKIPIEGAGGEAGKDKFHYLVVTASHVADQVSPPAGTHWTRHREERDVAVRDLSADELVRAKSASDALLLPPLQQGGEDITGEVGTVIGHGNGMNAPVRKMYPSRLSPKISFPVLTAAYVRLPEAGKKYMHATDFDAVRMITLPYDEAAKRGPNKDQPTPMNRASGSAFVYIPKGSKEMAFGGILVSGVKAYPEGVSYDVGFILDHMYVREAIDEHLKGVVR